VFFFFLDDEDTDKYAENTVTDDDRLSRAWYRGVRLGKGLVFTRVCLLSSDKYSGDYSLRLGTRNRVSVTRRRGKK
jgi:hypothetical protein